MNPETEKIIKDQIAKLPNEVRKAIADTDVQKELSTISSKYNLKIDQAGLLETETILVMIALESPEDFINNLINNAGISREDAPKIASEVNDLIFKKIKSALMNIVENEEVKLQTSNPNVQIKKEESNKEIQKESLVKADILSEIENPKPIFKPEPSLSIPKPPVPTPATLQNTPPIAIPKPPTNFAASSIPKPPQIERAPINPPKKIEPVPVNIIADKLGGITRLAPENKIISSPLPSPTTPKPINTDSNSAPVPTPPKFVATPNKPGSYTVDPYKEPVE